MSRTQVILRNILSNWAAFGVHATVIFFLTPYVLRHLGDTRYGLWILSTSISGHYGLLALGFQGGVNQYLTRYLARRDYDKMNRVASTAQVTFCGVGILVVAFSCLVAWVAPSIFNIPSSMETEVFWCLIITGISIAVQLTLFLFSATLMATQRYDLANLVNILTRLINAAMVGGAVYAGFGLIAVCLASAATDIVSYLVRWRIAYRIIPQLVVARKSAGRCEFREMFSYGSWSFLINIGQSIFAYLDAIVIGALLPVAAIAPYSLASGLIRQLERLLRPIDQVFFPAFTELHARNEIDTLRKVYLTGSRFFLVAVSISAVLAGFWAEDFYRLWVGEKYISNSEFPSVALLFQILLIAMIGRLFPALGAQVLQGSLYVRPLAIMTILEALTNALLSIVLVRYYGLIGVALGTLISVFLIRTFTIPILLEKRLTVTVFDYVQKAAFRPFLMAVLLSIIAVLIRSLGEPTGFGTLIAQGVLALMAAAPLALFVGLSREDRTTLVYRTIKTSWSRLVQRQCEPTSAGS